MIVREAFVSPQIRSCFLLITYSAIDHAGAHVSVTNFAAKEEKKNVEEFHREHRVRAILRRESRIRPVLFRYY